MRSDRIYLDPIEARCEPTNCHSDIRDRCARATAPILVGSPVSDFSINFALGRAAPKTPLTVCVSFRLPQTRPGTTTAPKVHEAIKGIA